MFPVNLKHVGTVLKLIDNVNKPPHSRKHISKPHEPTLKPKACKRASASPARVTAFQDGFRIAHAQKNKINLCFVDRLVQVENDKKLKLNK